MDDITRGLRKVNPDDINPRYNWGRHLPALGTMGVDFEERVTISACTITASAARARR